MALYGENKFIERFVSYDAENSGLIIFLEGGREGGKNKVSQKSDGGEHRCKRS